MERHKSLYKELNVGTLSPRQYNRLNREHQNANRAEKRMQSYLNSRNISLSPSPLKMNGTESISATSTPTAHRIKEQNILVSQTVCTDLKKNLEKDVTNPSNVKTAEIPNKLNRQNAIDIEDKENFKTAETKPKESNLIAPKGDDIKFSEKGVSRIAKVACGLDSEKLSRQEQFLKKYVDWKKEKKMKEEDRKKQQPKPFVPSGMHIKANSKTTPTSFAPKNYQFKPPVGLKQPVVKSVQLNQIDKKARQSIYTIVPTPPRKNRMLDMNKQSNHKRIPIKEQNSDFASNGWQEKVIVPNLENVNKNKADTILKSAGDTKPAPQVEKKKTVGYTPCSIPRSGVPKKSNNIIEANIRNAGLKKVHSFGSEVAQKTPGTRVTVEIPKKDEKSVDKVTSSTRSAISTTSTHNFVKPRALQFPQAASRITTGTLKRTDSNIVKSTQSSANTVKPVQTNANTIKSFQTSTNVKSTQKPTHINASIAKPNTAIATVAKSVQSGSVSKPVAKVNSGAIGKARVLQNKRDAATRPIHKSGNLTTNLKSKRIEKLPQKNIKKAVDLLKIVKSPQPVLQTPIEMVNVNPFEAFVTSTKMKSPLSNAIDDISDTISPVEPLESQDTSTQRPRSTTTVKRTLMLQDEKTNNVEKLAPRQCKKIFNFLRHSVLEHESPPDGSIENQPIKNEMLEKDKTMKTSEQTQVDNAKYKTPPKVESDDRPSNYLSPFVSVSRGKVSLKKEKEKRDSIYLVSASENIANENTDETTLSVEVLRTLETIRYFRKQLNDEIKRLHALCDSWDLYKADNVDLLQEKGGDDMINVTVGQTKLLTSKKFMQFNGLIDRCEKGAIGKGDADDGSENTKPITAIDLEGFWSMLGLQIDNVDKRFENLNRWRDNGWIDPDAVAKPKEKLRKIKKNKIPTAVASKSKPNSAFREILRKIHAERKNKANANKSEVVESNVVSSPTHKRRSRSGTPNSNGRSSSTPRRFSILVRDRKSFSRAPTILTMTPTSHRSSMTRKSTEGTPNCLGVINEFKRSLTNVQQACPESSDLLKTAIRGAEQQRRKSTFKQTTPSPPLASSKGRKSILKTPGTAKGKPKNVNFNEQLRIQKFKFIVDDEEESSEEHIIENEQFLSDYNEEQNNNTHRENKTIKSLNEHFVDKLKLSFKDEVRRNKHDLEQESTDLNITKEDYKGEETPQREYRLRTRRVKLRPSCEIVIPK